ncbi:MAG TPA: YbhB/YbcL family Raf kinase inhibitor-like protein [Caulobacteraceae bacterium]|nr:YbhB/YbcL family Raf kinase inhibitor-like protein [Caulobacteraceae bacterium]
MRWTAAIILALGLAACGRGQPAAPKPVAMERVKPAAAPAPLVLQTSAFAPGGKLTQRQSAYGDNVSPALRWTARPEAQSYALIVEDPDAKGPRPFVHWMIWNIPADMTALPDSLPGEAQPHAAPDAVQGRNDAGTIGWYGPRPSAGTGLHHYHFQLFGLDGPLNLGPDARLADLEAAMKGHIVAQGELVGVYQAPKG